MSYSTAKQREAINQEVSALSFLLEKLQKNQVITFYNSREPDVATPVQVVEHLAKLFVRDTNDTFCICGIMYPKNEYVIAYSLERERFQVPELSYDTSKHEKLGDLIVDLLRLTKKHGTPSRLTCEDHCRLIIHLLTRLHIPEAAALDDLMTYIAFASYPQFRDRMSRATECVQMSISVPQDSKFEYPLPYINVDAFQRRFKHLVPIPGEVPIDLETRHYTPSVHNYIVTVLQKNVEIMNKKLERLLKSIEDYQSEKTPRESKPVGVFEIIVHFSTSQSIYNNILLALRPFMPYFIKVLDSHNELDRENLTRSPWNYKILSPYCHSENFDLVDGKYRQTHIRPGSQDEGYHVDEPTDYQSDSSFKTFGESFVTILGEPRLKFKSLDYIVLNLRDPYHHRRMHPLATFMTNVDTVKFAYVPNQPLSGMANLRTTLQNSLDGHQEMTKRINVLLDENHSKFSCLKSKDSQEFETNFTGRLHCETVAVSLLLQDKYFDRDQRVLPIIGISRHPCVVCFNFLDIMLRTHCPRSTCVSFTGVNQVSNRAWQTRLPPDFEVDVGHKMIVRLRRALGWGLFGNREKIRQWCRTETKGRFHSTELNVDCVDDEDMGTFEKDLKTIASLDFDMDTFTKEIAQELEAVLASLEDLHTT